MTAPPMEWQIILADLRSDDRRHHRRLTGRELSGVGPDDGDHITDAELVND
jgi:hypothetical protein